MHDLIKVHSHRKRLKKKKEHMVEIVEEGVQCILAMPLSHRILIFQGSSTSFLEPNLTFGVQDAQN